jgi:ATP-dependent DNA helicase RecG
MAPTELLAKQHFNTLANLQSKLPEQLRPRIALVTSKERAAERRKLSAAIAAGDIDLVVGTQALLQKQSWASLGLAIIDEQHRFGVNQREELARSAGHLVHTLLMTATPIPRSLALVQCGSVALSSINEAPAGRRPVETHVVLDNDRGRGEVYAAIREELKSGGRVYIVCPLVEATNSSSSSDAETGAVARRTVMDEFERLSREGVFESARVGLLHGKLTADEKAAALQKFSRYA